MTSFLQACSKGNKELAKELFDNNTQDHHWGLTYACINNHIETVKLFIGNLSIDELNIGLHYACFKGHVNIVELLINNRCNSYNIGLTNACYDGHREVIELMINKGANNWDEGLKEAQYWNNKEIVLLMLENGADINKCSMKLNFDDIYYLIQKGVNTIINYPNITDNCQKFRYEFYNVAKELFIPDIVKILIRF